MAPTTAKKRRANPKVQSEQTEQITDEDKNPGVVYIGHVPHGFYEDEMIKYFSQFGKVLSLRLARSKKNGKSKGYAFVKFRYAAVAKTVAESCNNYLFFNKLMKCEYKPTSEVHRLTFLNRKADKPNVRARRLHNAPKEGQKVETRMKETVSRQKRKLSKLAELGVSLKLEDVVDVPEVTASTETANSVAKTRNSLKRKRSTSRSTSSAKKPSAPSSSSKKKRSQGNSVSKAKAIAGRKSQQLKKSNKTKDSSKASKKSMPKEGRKPPKKENSLARHKKVTTGRRKRQKK